VAILLLLQAAFGSMRLAALTFLLLPMALVGGVLAVWLTAACCRWARWSGSSPCSASLRATASS
jgi:Cu/Ag efflux pump CusA